MEEAVGETGKIEEEEAAKEAETVEREKAEVEETKIEREEDEFVDERIYTIPLSRAWISPRKKRAPRTVKLIKKFIQRHMKPEALIISNEVNERIWSRGIEKPPRKIKVRASRDKEGKVTVRLAQGD